MRALIPIFLAAAAACHAGAVPAVDIFPSTLSGNPGDMLQFFGSVSNFTGATLFINSNSFTFVIAGAVDDTPFLTNAPLSLSVLESAGPFEFLDVMIPLLQAPGSYAGVFTVLGGATDTDSFNLGQASFNVVVNGTAAPEPGSMVLVTLGMVAAWLARRNRLRRAGAGS